MNNALVPFEGQPIRRVYDEKTETWYFSVVDIIQVLTQQPDFQAARNYWKVLKNRLLKERSQPVTNCNRLKMQAEDGKMRLTDAADPETLLRLIQSVPSPKAEPIKLWLAKVGYERMQEIADPERSLARARENWQKHERANNYELGIMTYEEDKNTSNLDSRVRRNDRKVLFYALRAMIHPYVIPANAGIHVWSF